MSRLLAMIHKEFIQMRRDRLTLGIMGAIPVIQLLLFGYAIQTEVKHLPTVVLDEANTSETRALADAFVNTASFEMVGRVASRIEVDRALASGRARAAILIPWSYPRDLARGRTAVVQVIVDATDPLASQAAIQAAGAVGRVEAFKQLRKAGADPRMPIEVRVRPRYNPGLESANNIVPGLIGVILSLTLVAVTSMAIVRERERGSLEQLIVTPLSRLDLMLGKIAPYVLVGYVQVTVVLLAGRLVFGVPISGNIALFYLITLGFIVATLGVGLFVSTVARTQQQALQMSFFFVLPNILLSGFMFPREAMPQLAQWLGLVLPLTHYLEVLRGILLKGLSLGNLWHQVVALLLFAVGFIVLSTRRFHKTLD
ncbi:MAG TPA: ABC transporter permease [Gemmatimonadales bacterium]